MPEAALLNESIVLLDDPDIVSNPVAVDVKAASVGVAVPVTLTTDVPLAALVAFAKV